MTTRRFTNTLLFRTFRFDFVLVLLSIAAATGFSLFNARVMLRQNCELRARSILAVLARDTELPLLLNNRAELQEVVDKVAQTDGVLGAIVYPRQGDPVKTSASRFAVSNESLTSRQTVWPERAANLIDWGGQANAGPAPMGVVEVTLSLRDQNVVIRRTTAFSLVIGAVIVLLACVAQYYRLRRVLRPLERLVRAAGRVEAGEMVFAEEGESVFEYKRLTEAFNRMVSSLKGTLEELQRSEERYVLAVEGSNDGIWDLDLATGKLYLSARWKEMLGFESDELSPDLDGWMSVVHPDDRDKVRRALDAQRAGDTMVLECEYRCYDKAGSLRWMRCRGKAFRPAIGSPSTRVAGSQTDITKVKAFDPLTGLPNRVLFRECLGRAVERRAPAGAQNAVLLIDVDGFTPINDTLGHLAGDRLLNEIAVRLKAAAGTGRASGLFTDWTLARFGGDEYALLLEDVRGAAEAIAAHLAGVMREPFLVDRRTLFLTISTGMATAGGADEIMRDAEAAMYAAKAAGTGQFRVFADHMRERALERLLMEAELRHALDRGEFALYYQPKVRLADQRATDFEALIRWNHPTRGVLAPGQFIGFAEESGLIDRIGAWVIREAARQSAAWLRKYPGRQFSISVNVSPRQLAADTLLDVVGGALVECEIPAGYLNLEVTESAVMENPERAAEVLNELHRMGVGIHVDDFGTGHSSLESLRRYPFDTLKIDRSFLTDLDRNAEGAAIVRAIVALGKALNLDVVAEGLESADQVTRTTILGCTYGQGYYFGRPATADVAEVLLAGEFLRPQESLTQMELEALRRALTNDIVGTPQPLRPKVS